MSSNASSFISNYQKPEVAVDVGHQGYLVIKRGLLKTADKRYYFVTHRSPELYSYGSMDENNSGGSHPERMVSVMIGSASKCITLRLGAESAEKATQWVEALQEVQTLLLLQNALPVNMMMPAGYEVRLEKEGAKKTSSKRRQVEEEEAAAVSTPTSHTESSPTSASGTSEHVEAPVTSAPIASPSSSSNTTTTGAYSLPHPRIRRMDSVASCSSTASGQSQGSTNGNVLLFVPVAGSSLTASASRMAKAQQELDALVAKGAKVPSRVMENPSEGKPVEWRYGAPEYVLTDLAYVKGRSREPDGTPLASYVEECCQTLIMEATHKVRYDQWHSVNLDTFYLQVNDGERVPGASILENDMLGLLYLGGIDISTVGEQTDSDESQDPRAELAEAFPDGFPMEVLEVFTQPPQCYFSWRHWGPFSGKYRGVKGDGSRVEVRGFGEMTVDASRIRSLRLFFKYQDLFAGLRRASDRVVRNRREAVSIAAPMSLNITPGRPLRTGSAAVAPVAPLVIPHFDDDDDSSSDSDLDEPPSKSVSLSTSMNKNHYGSGSISNNNDEDDHDEDEAADGVKSSQNQPRDIFQSEIQWDRVQELQELTNANTTLTSEARDLRQQVKALQIQLEAQIPVPGLDIDAVQDMLLDKDSVEHDVRDVKIVHQAKSLRALKRSFQREKQLAGNATKQCKLLEATNKKLEQEVDTLQLKLQRFLARAAAAEKNTNANGSPQDDSQNQHPGSPTPSTSDGSNDTGILRKMCEELKSKNVALQQELKKTQRALVREVGDDVPLEDILGNTDSTVSGASRRGRAQHIVMLKAKVKKLQTQLVPLKSGSTSAGSQDSTNVATVIDVDQRAQQDLSGQQMHRQKRVDQLTSQRDDLEERLHRLTRKYDALKARAQILDREKQETRNKFQVLVEKSRNDDALVDALQRQLETWKGKLHEARRARTADGSTKGSASQEERTELERLRKIVSAHKGGGGGDRVSTPLTISGGGEGAIGRSDSWIEVTT
ncbi:hypothetical protein G195_006725 [Phytophthora kernoviae 00238/432]|uniref:PH domain-containing protein n=2 Tax=Phytophthora kernoviae TaxID=325452 RepID=A0A8T0LV02_9STRA|nr:hypothetical protein G195_006725 [Phytophthora kernoviae 00238/432]KAG2522494.1 hypothetical protein JM16_005638 [Phytophthora kernoviae]